MSEQYRTSKTAATPLEVTRELADTPPAGLLLLWAALHVHEKAEAVYRRTRGRIGPAWAQWVFLRALWHHRYGDGDPLTLIAEMRRNRCSSPYIALVEALAA